MAIWRHGVVGFLLAVVVGFGMGCARHVTDKTSFLTLEIKVTFRGNPDPSQFRYYVMFSADVTPLAPIPPPDSYFPTPGSLFNESNSFLLVNGGLNYYYRTYFKTWSDYIVVNGSSLKLFKSNASGFNENTQNNLVYIPETGLVLVNSFANNQWIIQVPLSLLSSSSTLVYFNLATARVTDGTDSGMIVDTIKSNFPVLQNVNRAQISGIEQTDFGAAAQADIVGWEARLF